MFAKRKERKRLTAELRARAARLPDADGGIAPESFQDFFQFVVDHGVALSEHPDVRRTLLLGLAQRGYFLQVPTTLLLKNDESTLYETSVALLKEVKDRQFVGGSHGVSVPLGGGVRYRAGAYRGHMVTVGSHWEPADTGALTITDQRVVFHGGRKTLEFPYGKLATLDAYSDAIALGVTSRQTTSTFRTDDGPLLAGLIHSALDHRDDGVTMIKISGDQ